MNRGHALLSFFIQIADKSHRVIFLPFPMSTVVNIRSDALLKSTQLAAVAPLQPAECNLLYYINDRGPALFTTHAV